MRGATMWVGHQAAISRSRMRINDAVLFLAAWLMRLPLVSDESIATAPKAIFATAASGMLDHDLLLGPGVSRSQASQV